jgi:hypothetical protein
MSEHRIHLGVRSIACDCDAEIRCVHHLLGHFMNEMIRPKHWGLPGAPFVIGSERLVFLGRELLLGAPIKPVVEGAWNADGCSMDIRRSARDNS